MNMHSLFLLNKSVFMALFGTIRCLFLVGIALGYTATALAGITKNCEPEPTDMSITYGDVINCDIEIEGESDTYRAYFNIGDSVRLEATDTGDVTFSMSVFDPTGQEIFYDHANVVSYNDIISTAGIYTLVAESISNSETPAYSLYLTCIGGSCMPTLVPDVTTGGGVSLSSAYVNLDITNGHPPPTTHCQDDSHYGRMVLDDVKSILYVCDQTGWTAH